MKVSLSRLSSVVVSLFVLIGCAAGGQENPKAFTVANLQGSYDLNTDAMPSNPAGDDGFNMISEMLDIDANTLTFAPTFAGMGPFTLTGRTLTVTRSNGYADVIQATFHDTGNTLTLIDEINEDVETFVFIRRDKTGTSNEVTGANLQGTYDLDATNTRVKNFPLLVSGEFEVAGNIVTTSLTFSQTRSFTLAGNTITLAETDGGTTVVRGTLSHDGNTLTLAFVEDRDTSSMRDVSPEANLTFQTERSRLPPCVDVVWGSPKG